MRTRTRLLAILLIALGLMAIVPARPEAVVQTAQITVDTTPTLIWTAPAGSGRVLIRNPSTTVSVFVGNSAVTTSTGFEIGAGAALGIVLLNRGTIYGVVAAATQVVETIQGDNIQ
jgi:hypothetical protein